MFFEQFVLEPWRRRSFPLALFRWSQFLGEKSNGFYDLVFQMMAALLRPSRTLPSPQRMTLQQTEAAAAQIKRDGYSILPVCLSQAELEELKAFAFSTPTYAWDRTKVLLSPDAIPTSTGRFIWPMQDLLQLNVIKRLVSDSGMARIAQDYLGAQTKLAHVTLWLDPPYDGDFDPHVYHYDNDGPGFLKFFHYVTDVEEDTGAHRFIRGTHHDRKPALFRHSTRYDDKALLDFYGADKEIVFAAPAGTIIAEDTDGFHRGSHVKHHYRILLQFEFSLIDIPVAEELENPITPVLIPDLDPALEPIVSKLFRSGRA